MLFQNWNNKNVSVVTAEFVIKYIILLISIGLTHETLTTVKLTYIDLFMKIT